MKKALELINSNKVYKKIFNEVYKKYKIYGKITGSFTLKATCKEEIEVLFNFDSRVITDGKAKIKSRTVEELFNRKLENSTFQQLLVKVIGEELKTNKEVKIKEKDDEILFYEKIVKISKNGVGKKWFMHVLQERSYGYNVINRRYNQDKSSDKLEELKSSLVLIINALNELPCLNNEYENIAVFAAIHTKDSHFFDNNFFTGRLFIKALSFTFNKSEPTDINELNELYYEAGIIKDEISNHTTIYGLSGFDKDNKAIASINSFNNWKEPLQISVSNLLKIDYLKAINNTVFIFENPAVFHKILKKVEGNISLICTSGQLNLSSYMILNKIKDLESIYYAGDFDPEGLLIAYKLKERYNDKLKFLCYSKENYLRCISNNIIDNARMKKLNKINCVDLEEIINKLNVNRRAAYQELLINDYINEIIKISRK